MTPDIPARAEQRAREAKARFEHPATASAGWFDLGVTGPKDAPLLADVAIAAARLAAGVRSSRPIDGPWWAMWTDEYEFTCLACGEWAMSPKHIGHKDDCPAIALDAALAALAGDEP